jgi:FAD/FMN-containing dehydrogenase
VIRSLAPDFDRIQYDSSEMLDQTRTTGAYGIMQRIKQQLDPDNVFPSLPIN